MSKLGHPFLAIFFILMFYEFTSINIFYRKDFMKIGFNYGYNGTYPNFKGRIDKIITELQTKNYKNIKITIDEAVKIYQKLGYSTTQKAGSHITVTHPNGFSFCLARPHGDKFIPEKRVKTLQCAVFEDFKQLIQSIQF